MKMLYVKLIKPVLDLVLAMIGFILMLPIFIAACLILAIANNGSIFFCQERPGKNEHIFKIIKFKTMNDKKDKNGVLLPAGDRLTKAGIFFRKHSLDEIPQLLNVLKGDMSIIGPRPLLTQYLPLYNEFQKQRHNIKPGITGWAQVNGRNAINWEQKFEFDVWYVQNMSLLLDLKILALTVVKVFKQTGINTDDNEIMPDFKGTNLKHNAHD